MTSDANYDNDGSMSSDPSGPAPRLARGVYTANLVAQMGIVVTGAVVRLTSSGLGCPTWPRCTADSYVPVAGQTETWHKYVEFGNRSLTFVLVILAIAALAVGYLDLRRRSREGRAARPQLMAFAAVPFIGTFAQALLGGVTVLTGLSPLVVAAHLLVSLGIIALMTNLVKRASEPDDIPITWTVRCEIRIGAWLLTGLMAAVLTLGTLVTASGPHAGDERVARLGFDPQEISSAHADLVLLSIGLMIGLIVALRATDGASKAIHAAMLAFIVYASQGFIGFVQYFTGLPWLVVALHVLGSTVVWWATVRFLLSTRARGMVSD